jgi:glucose 1-dehydrogenase
MDQRLAGKFALITGASSGIGRGCAVRFAQEGAHIAIHYGRSKAGAEETAKQVAAAQAEAGTPDPKCIILQADLAEETQILAMYKSLWEQWDRLDILINNAGLQIQHSSHECPTDDFDKVINVNLRGAYLCSREALAHFVSRPGGGCIVNDSSVAQIIPKPEYIGYSISKAGMANLTRTLALEYADKGIRVNAVGPGAVVTPINDAWIHDEKMTKIVENHIPMARAATIEEIAPVFAFLASDEASYITGQTLYACGGLTLYMDFKHNWSS